MRIFLSYASEQTDIAEGIDVALSAEDHTVFRDRSGLPPGDAFHDRIRDALAESDLLVFLVSPESVARGRYTITELELAEQQWRNPSDRVLPVVVRPTDLQSIPAYLRSVTLLEPRGNVAAGVVGAVARIASPRWRRLFRQWAPAIAVVVLVAAVFLVRWVMEQRGITNEIDRLLETGRAAQSSRDYPAAWAAYKQASAVDPNRTETNDARERLAMEWVRNIRKKGGTGTLTEIVELVEPILSRCAAASKTVRAADCEAHLGWCEFLRYQEGARKDEPVVHYRRAIALDPQNVYGHAMWGFDLLQTGGSRTEAASHFADAIKSGRERAYVRSLHLAAFRSNDAETGSAKLLLANDIRVAGESLPAEAGVGAYRLFSIYQDRVLNQYELPSFLQALSPADHLATFQWLFPEPDPDASKDRLKRYVLATLQEHAGQRDAALANFIAVRDSLAKDGSLESGGSLPEGCLAAVKRLSGQ